METGAMLLDNYICFCTSNLYGSSLIDNRMQQLLPSCSIVDNTCGAFLELANSHNGFPQHDLTISWSLVSDAYQITTTRTQPDGVSMSDMNSGIIYYSYGDPPISSTTAPPFISVKFDKQFEQTGYHHIYSTFEFLESIERADVWVNVTTTNIGTHNLSVVDAQMPGNGNELTVIETNVPVTIQLWLDSCSDCHISLTAEHTDVGETASINAEFDSVDVISTGIGTPYATASDKVSNCHREAIVSANENYFNVLADGILTGFHIESGIFPGEIRFEVYRPQTVEGSVNLMRPYAFNNSENSPPYSPFFEMDMVVPSRDLFEFGHVAPHVFTGDIIAITTGTSGIQVDYSKCDNKRTDFDPFMAFKAILNIPFEYQENLTFTTPGHVKVLSDITNAVSNSLKTFSIPIQDRIVNLAMDKNEVCIIGTDCTIDVTETKGTNVTYHFYINGTLKHSSTIGSFLLYPNVTTEGWYNVSVRGENLINNETDWAIYFVDSPIQLVELTPSKALVLENEEFDMRYAASSGLFTFYTLTVTSEDGTTTDVVPITALDNLSVNLTIGPLSYPTCGMYTFIFSVSKDYTSIGMTIQLPSNESTIVVEVQCTLKGFDAKPFPEPDSSGVVELGINKVLTVDINLEAGADPEFEADWGDGTTKATKSFVGETPSFPFPFKHTYTSGGNYTITLLVWNKDRTLDPIIIPILISQCTFPEVTFSYGSLIEPNVHTRGKNILLEAKYKFTSDKCEQEQTNQFNVVAWKLVKMLDDGTNANTTMNDQFAEISFDRSIKKATYKIPSLSLDEGFYVATLTVDDSTKRKDYFAYLRVKQTPLFVEIENGAEREIAAFELDADDKQIYTDFSVNAGKNSFDPDDKPNGLEGFTFTWYCKFVSSQAQVDGAVASRSQSNITLYNYTRCLHSELTEQSEKGGELVLNSEMFLEGIQYSLTVVINKDTRVGNYTQLLTIKNGSAPNVRFECIKCQPKLNIMDFTTIKYSSNTSYANLAAEWLISSVNESLWTDPARTSTGFQKANLVILPNQLLPVTKYTFTLRIGFIGSDVRNLFRFEMETGRTPYGGECSVLPKQGFITDKYRIRCNNWKNDGEPIKYEFGYFIRKPGMVGLPADTEIKTLQASEQKDLLDQSFPAGEIQIYVRILNEFGQYVILANKELSFINDVPEPTNLNDLLGAITSDAGSSSDNATANANATTTAAPETKGVYEDLSDSLGQIQPQDPTSVNDVVNAAIFKMAVLDATQKQEDAVPTKPPAIDPLTGQSYDDNADKEQLEEEGKNLRQKHKENVLNMINQTVITKPEEVKAVADVLTETTNTAAELTEEARETTMNILLNVVEKMDQMKDTIGIKQTQENVQSCLNVVANAVSSELASAKVVNVTADNGDDEEGNGDEGQSNGGNTQKTKQTTKTDLKRATKLKESIDTLANVMNKNMVTGEQAVTFQTSTLTVALVKKEKADLANMTVGDNQAKLPLHTEDLFGDQEVIGDVSVQNVQFKENIFQDGETSQNVKTGLQSLVLKTEAQGQITINNTASPITIVIENDENQFDKRNVSTRIPGFLIMEEMKVDPSACKITLRFTKEDSVTNLTVLVQYGKPPTKDEYDAKFILTEDFPETNGESTIMNITAKYHKMLDARTLLMWNLEELPYGDSNQTKMFMAFSFEGPIPDNQLHSNPYTKDIRELPQTYNYTLNAFCAECSYWDAKNESWSTEGCTVSGNETTINKTVCKCNHLTSFGGMFVAPNPLPTPSLALLKEGYVLLVTIASMLFIYVIGLVFARRIDKADLDKVGCYPLVGNQKSDKYLYQITVNTGTRREAGTTSNIYFNLSGTQGESGVRLLKDEENRAFIRGSSLTFVMSTEKNLGDLVYLRIWIDNTGGDWYLRNMEVIDLQSQEDTTFIVGKWFSVEKEEGFLVHNIAAASDSQMKEFNYLFANHARRQFADTHIWFSVYARPPESSFTRCQRLSVAMSLLFSVMLANIMFYGAVPAGTPETENNIRGFTFTWPQVMVGVQSALITVPVNILLVFLFNAIRMKELPVKVIDDIENGSSDDDESDIESVDEEEQEVAEKKKKKRKKFTLPHWVLYPTWALCILIILGCAFMVVWYGMAFGNAKSLEWLGSVTIGLLQDILLMQPLKVFVMALVVALFIKKLEKQEMERMEKELDNVKSWFKNPLEVADDSIRTSIFDRANTDHLLPPDKENLSVMRQYAYKQRKMKAIVKEIMYYLIYAVVITLLGYSLRDYNAFYQTRNLETLFKVRSDFLKVVTKDQFWDYVNKTVINGLYPHKWYDIDDKWKDQEYVHQFPGGLFLDDGVTKILTGARLRQLRVPPSSCIKAKEIKKDIRQDCLGYYDLLDEQETAYDQNWTIYDTNYRKGKRLTARTMPWTFQEDGDLDGFPASGEISTYGGGGYVAEIFPKWNNEAIIQNLKDKLWIDRHTRAVYIEFGAYNAGTNYFNSIVILFEFPPYGGVIQYHYFITFRVLPGTNDWSFMILMAEICFLIFTVLFLIREGREMYRDGILKYATQFWNMIEMLIIVFCFLTIGLTFYKETFRKSIVNRLPDKVPNIYINLQYASYVDLTLLYSFALICFFILLKFVKLLRFNKRISMLARTLKRAGQDLLIFGFQFAIVLVAFTFSGTLAFGKDLYGYKDNWSTFASVIRLILGKFDFSEFAQADEVLGPMWFNLFHIGVNFIVMNMYISILNDALSAEYAELGDRENDFEVVEYMVSSFKEYLGMASITREKDVFVDDRDGDIVSIAAEEYARDMFEKRHTTHAHSAQSRSKMSLKSTKSLMSTISLKSKTSENHLIEVDDDDGETTYHYQANDDVINIDDSYSSSAEELGQKNGSERELALSTTSFSGFGKYERTETANEEELLAAEQFMFTLAKVRIYGH
uniref:Polycystic kidney disease protein 1-like 2 n=2 Tax=Clytia hemisphaerica TaxID=252671 RepID=A0A7M5V1G8_9CNID